MIPRLCSRGTLPNFGQRRERRSFGKGALGAIFKSLKAVSNEDSIMAEINHNPSQHETISDETLLKHVSWCGVIVAAIAMSFAWIANTLG